MTGSLLFFDTETTGIVKGRPDPMKEPGKWPRLVEIAWIQTDAKGEIITSSEMMIYPDGFDIPSESTAIHGITTQEAKAKGIPLKEAVETFREVVLQSDALIAHNIWFDAGVIDAEGTRLGMTPLTGDIKKICTMLETTTFCGIRMKNGKGYKWPGLAELYQILFGSALSVKHRAADDTRVCMSCYQELVKRGVLA